MSVNFTGNTSIPGVFTIGWFRFPKSADNNNEVVVIFYDIFVVLSLLTDPFLLYVIVKTYNGSSGKNSSILLAFICLTNIFVTVVGTIKLIGSADVDYGIIARVKSIFLPMYYITTFCLALNNYALIVTPLKFQTLSPKPKTIVGCLEFVWVILALVFVLTPALVSDFDQYARVMLITVVGLCWLESIVVLVMYTRILFALYERKITLRKTLNMSRSKQGLVVIKQNSRLARVLFLYIIVLVLFTLPLFTTVILEPYCQSKCNRSLLLRFSLYTIPLGMSMPVVHVIHWLFFKPLYFKEVKRLLRKLVAFFGMKERHEIAIETNS